MRQGVVLLPIASLRAHEQVCPQRLEQLLVKIKQDGRLKNPIVVDRKTSVILDGHHRVECLRLMGCRLAPAMAVDYMSDRVRVFSRRKIFKVNKAPVLELALAGRPFPYKTTRNWIKGRIRGVNIRLDKLK